LGSLPKYPPCGKGKDSEALESFLSVDLLWRYSCLMKSDGGSLAFCTRFRLIKKGNRIMSGLRLWLMVFAALSLVGSKCGGSKDSDDKVKVEADSEKSWESESAEAADDPVLAEGDSEMSTPPDSDVAMGDDQDLKDADGDQDLDNMEDGDAAEGSSDADDY
jgi:hypothetical protein